MQRLIAQLDKVGTMRMSGTSRRHARSTENHLAPRSPSSESRRAIGCAPILSLSFAARSLAIFSNDWLRGFSKQEGREAFRQDRSKYGGGQHHHEHRVKWRSTSRCPVGLRVS